MSSAKIKELLEGCEHFDKDIRQMAAMDLCKEVKTMSDQQRMEEAMERRICSAFIKHLNDTSLEVKANAVKSITIVVPIIREQNVVMIIETLTNMVIDASAKDVRDIYSLTIRTSLVELKDQAAINMIRAVYPKLKNGLKSNKEEVQEECIEILSEIFRNFGQILFKNNNLVNKDEVMKILLDILSQSSKNLRKKATVCLGQFGIILNVRQLLQLVSVLMDRLGKSHDKHDKLTFIQCMGQISGSVGEKLVGQNQNITQQLSVFPAQLEDNNSIDIDNEISEASMVTIANMIKKNQNDVKPTMRTLWNMTSVGISYDPNYTYQENEDEDMDQDEDDAWGELDDFYEGDQMDDDDDTAWKVRKGSVKIIDSIVINCPGHLEEYGDKYIDLLSSRFIERDDYVKIDIIETFQHLIRSFGQQDFQEEGSSDPMLMRKKSSGKDQFLSKFQNIIQMLAKQYGKTKNIQVKVSIMKTFSTLAMIVPDEMEKSLGSIIEYMEKSMDEGNNDLILYSLQIMKYTFRKKGVASMSAQNYSKRITNFLSLALDHSQFKIVSESLRVTGKFVIQLKDLDEKFDAKFSNEAKTLYKGIYLKLEKGNVDQEVKQNSIIAMANLLTISHTHFGQPELNNVIGIFGERLTNQMSRIASLRGLYMLATVPQSNGVPNLQNLQPLVAKFIDLLHQADRQVHLETLSTLAALLERYSNQFAQDCKVLQGEIAKCIDESDIQRSALAIKCASIIIKLNKNLPENKQVIDKSVVLTSSELIQGQKVVSELQAMFAQACAAGIVHNNTVEDLINKTNLKTRSCAKIAGTIIAQNFNIMGQYLNMLFGNLQNANLPEDDVVKSVLVLGEVGVLKDLSQMQNIIGVISGLFKHQSDQVRQASAISLGSLSIGNTEFFLKKVFEMIKNSQPQEKYMFLSTIREIIVNKPGCLGQYLDILMPLYLEHANIDDEPIRNIVSESIGKLFLTFPEKIEPKLLMALNSNDVVTVATCARSFKYSTHNNKNHNSFKKFTIPLIKLIGNPDLAIKKNSLESLGQIVYNPNINILLANHVEELVQKALLETPVKQDLISVVDLGPFKYTVDNGADIRKAAFGLLENITKQFQFNQVSVVDAVINGFQDSNDDVQILCLSFMNKLIDICPAIVFQKLDLIVEKFNTIFSKNSNQLKNDASSERSLNLIRGILRVSDSLNKNQEASMNQAFSEWFNQNVLGNTEIPAIKMLYQQISGTSMQII